MKFIGLYAAVVCSAFIFCGCSGESSDEKLITAVSLAKQGKWDDAAAIANQAAEKSPESAAPMLLRALAYEKSGELNKAIDLAQQCAESNPSDFTVLYTLGRLYSLDPKRQDKAYTTLEKAAVLRKGDVNTLILICNIGVKNNEPNVEKYLEQLLRRSDLPDSERGKAYYMLGICQDKANKKSDAARTMAKAERFGKNNDPELLFYLARYYEKTDSAQAKILYDNFIRRYNKNTPGYDPDMLQEAQLRRKQLLRRNI